MKNNSIRTKMLVLVSIVIIPVMLLNLIRIKSDFDRRVDAEWNASVEFAEALSKSFETYLYKVWSNQYAMGLAINMNPQWTQRDIETYFKRILKNNDELTGYLWVGMDGTILVDTNKGMSGRTIAHRDYYHRLVAGEEKVISNLIFSMYDNRIVLPIARKIIIDGRPTGIMVSIIDINKLNKILDVKRIHKTSSYGLVDKSGLIVYEYGKDNMPYEERMVKPDSSIWRALRGEIVKITDSSFGMNDKRQIGIEFPIREIGWGCFVTSSLDELLEKPIKDMVRDMLILYTVMICSFALAVCLSNRFIQSINRIREAAAAMAKGDYNNELAVDGEDELAMTSRAFGEMVHQVNIRIHEAEEFSKLKSQFFSTISHELKTPLNVILASTQLMEKLDYNDAEQYRTKMRRHLRMLKQNSLRLLRLISNLIDINKLEVSHLKIFLRNMDIVYVVEDIAMSVVEYAQQKGLHLVFDTEVEEKVMAFDPDMLERIILNLLSNAIKFTEPGGSIQVNIYDRQSAIIISVKDSGIGIPENMMEQIFNCFCQVDSSLGRKTEGSGIGLSLVKYLVELHGGAIHVNSELGKGSEFVIELPVMLVEDEAHIKADTGVAKVERIQIEFSDIYF